MAVKECLLCRDLAACVALVTSVAFPDRLWEIVNIPILTTSHDNSVACVVVNGRPLWSVCLCLLASETAGGLYNPVSVKGSPITGATTVNSTTRVVIARACVRVRALQKHMVYADRAQFRLIVSILSHFFSAGQREEALKQKGEIASELATLRDDLGKRPVKPHRQLDELFIFLYTQIVSGCRRTYRVSGSFSISADMAGLL